MAQINRQTEISLVVFMFLFGCAFLLKMCYLSLAFNTIFIGLFLTALYVYLGRRLGIRIPLVLLFFCLPRRRSGRARKLLSNVRAAVWANAVRRVFSHDHPNTGHACRSLAGARTTATDRPRPTTAADFNSRRDRDVQSRFVLRDY